MLVEDLVIARQWQGQGLATELLEALTLWAETKKATRMQLLADRSNSAALAFYDVSGWQATNLVCLRKRI